MSDALQSRLAENLLLFCRMLRRAGLAIGPGRVLDALRAVAIAGIEREDDFRAALRAVLVGDPAERRLFDQAFRLCFGEPGLLERAKSALLPDEHAAAENRAAEDIVHRLAGRHDSEAPDRATDAREASDRSATWSAKEVFKIKDFEQMSEAELRDARRLLRALPYPARLRQTRRFRASALGSQYDLRRSMQRLLRHDGEMLQLARRQRGKRPQTLVFLCDVSGSMSLYSRLFLHYAHALVARHRNVQVFVFGTRLSNITRSLRTNDVEVALQRVSRQVPDWDGGTRIAESLHHFNHDWSRRTLAGNATVVLLSDGFERDSGSTLEFEMQRLKRSCQELIWMNPMLRYEAFQPRAAGIRAMLPHVDRFIPAHSVASITELGRLLATGGGDGRNTKMVRAS